MLSRGASLALVLAATVLLVLGVLQEDGLVLVYLSIGCSIAAAVLLIVTVRGGPPEPEPVSPG